MSNVDVVTGTGLYPTGESEVQVGETGHGAPTARVVPVGPSPCRRLRSDPPRPTDSPLARLRARPDWNLTATISVDVATPDGSLAT